MVDIWSRMAVCAGGLVIAAPIVPGAPTAQATICGSVGGRHVDISGCADPLSELNDVLPPPPPPPAGRATASSAAPSAATGLRASAAEC